MKFKFPLNRVDWVNTSFLLGTLIVSITIVPFFIWQNAGGWSHQDIVFHSIMFFLYYCATGMSITLGYHRLFSHIAFKAKWPVKLFTLVFGACAFENSALDWSADHRRHHKHVDTDDDPYNINEGLFHAHIGWLLFKLRPIPPLNNVNDLLNDAWVLWQHRWWKIVGVSVGFLLPFVLGYIYGGIEHAWGCLLISGFLRVVAVQHSTFFINSLCHWIGSRPYSTHCTARDSWIMALFTFGEGYHNYHHEFQHDYRNGVKPWQFDPTKWSIWLLSLFGLTYDLRRVPDARILQREFIEAQNKVESQLAKISGIELSTVPQEYILNSIEYLKGSVEDIKKWCDELQNLTNQKIDLSKAKFVQMRRELDVILGHIQIVSQAKLQLA
jgi:stearoyl-CoA desaturase (delta-9 desaturase)